MQIARNAETLFAGGDGAQPSGQRHVLERGADFARHHPGHRHQLRRRRRQVGEEDAAAQVVFADRGRQHAGAVEERREAGMNGDTTPVDVRSVSVEEYTIPARSRRRAQHDRVGELGRNERRELARSVTRDPQAVGRPHRHVEPRLFAGIPGDEGPAGADDLRSVVDHP